MYVRDIFDHNLPPLGEMGESIPNEKWLQQIGKFGSLYNEILTAILVQGP